MYQNIESHFEVTLRMGNLAGGMSQGFGTLTAHPET